MQSTAVDKVVSSVFHRASIARTLTFGRVRRRMLTQLDLRQRPLAFAGILQQLAYNEQVGGSSPSAPTGKVQVAGRFRTTRQGCDVRRARYVRVAVAGARSLDPGNRCLERSRTTETDECPARAATSLPSGLCRTRPLIG
jgi:hypothetical protein